MAKIYDVVAGVGEYTDRQGNKKVKWLNCGAVFKTEKGLSIKLDAVPVGGDGWFKLFEPKQKQAPQQAAPVQSFDDEIPF